MRSSRTTILLVYSLVAMLSLMSGVVLAAADVESRAQPGGWSSRQNANDPTNVSVEQLKKMEFLQQEVQELRGKVEEQAYQLQQLQEQQKKLYLDLERKMQSAAAPKPAANDNSGITFDTEEPAKPAATTAPANEQTKATEEKSYQQAYHLIQNKDYEGALVAFKALIANFPQGKYQPNAHYWLGEIYVAKGNLDLAATAFNQVFTLYPEHPKAPDSLLKLGYVEYARGQWQRSKQFLSQVKTQFPDSTSAQLADSRLQRMQQEGHL